MIHHPKRRTGYLRFKERCYRVAIDYTIGRVGQLYFHRPISDEELEYKTSIGYILPNKVAAETYIKEYWWKYAGYTFKRYGKGRYREKNPTAKQIQKTYLNFDKIDFEESLYIIPT